MKHRNRKRINHSLRTAGLVLLYVSLLSGLIPPPVANSVLPRPAAQLAATWLPQPLIAWAQTVDFGDLPTAAQSGFASDYATTSATGGASHNVAAILRIGAQIDALSVDGCKSGQLQHNKSQA